MSKDGILNDLLGAFLASAAQEVTSGAMRNAKAYGTEVPRLIKNKISNFKLPVTEGGRRYVLATAGKASATGKTNQVLTKRRFSSNPVSKNGCKDICKRVKKIESDLKGVMSTLIFREWIGDQLTTSINTSAYEAITINDQTWIETAIAQMRYYDPATPGTIVVANGATGTYQRVFRVKSSVIMEGKNNYQIPVTVEIHSMACVADTGNSSYAYALTCLGDNSNLDLTSPIINLRDARNLGDLWKVEASKFITLLPGETFSIEKTLDYIDYDPSEYDNHTLIYQPDWKSFQFLVGVTGGIAHDKTTVTNCGLSAGGIDWVAKRQSVIRYNAGGPAMTYVYGVSALDAMAAGPIVSQVVVDNQEYSTT